MKTRRRKNANPVRRLRRGVTLVEMLVTLAVLLLMMALVVQIFQAATSSMNAAQVYQRLDDDLRRLDSTIRSDLSGATAKFTPPIDPADDQGYFEYTENEFADNDGEDCDDTIRLTVKAPDDRPFIGRMWAKPPKILLNTGAVYQMSYADLASNSTALANYLKSQPITVTSQHAEVIYFLRNGNLYRRVLLIAPELQTRIVNSYSLAGGAQNLGTFPGLSPGNGVEGPLDPSKGGIQVAFTPTALGGYQTSWQGVNDLSAHPSPRGTPRANQFNSVILNKLGDLSDRHNRFSMPRYSDDFAGPDGIADDLNSDSVPDWHPTLSTRLLEEFNYGLNNTKGLYNPIPDSGNLLRNACVSFADRFAFPYVFRGSYSRAQNTNWNTWRGWIHAPAPVASDGSNIYSYDQTQYLKYLNHNPLDLGDNLPAPTNANETGSNNLQTYWGWPTWRETLAPEWNDPTFQVNQTSAPYFPNALLPHTYAEITAGHVDLTGTSGQQLLPPLLPAWRGSQFDPFTDGAGSTTGFFSGNPNSGLWASASWEDDLILTNVRSFDVKAFEPALADYADLGWGDDQRITAAATSTIPGTANLASVNLGTGQFAPYMWGTFDAITGGVSENAYAFIHGRPWHVLNQTFAHEGRMPPLQNDCRYDAQFGKVVAGFYGSNPLYTGNLGDDANKTIRMRRTWDSWSTTYSKAIATGVVPGVGFPYGPPFTAPIYPSYPPPYPAPLRGIQIQVRVTDPTNQRIKVLTIRQDFTDKL
ncbi:prepilin-type N-terminal cleavage/methylation domain-containing protein [Paludisphaera rhizosphaerae]|uniref:prepilin-type N-terminal cleavage/methylation domain-containing protein n=1 Tax=Paludisphaera rhizosphaerae TaxID=2711216 RepID=UPI001F0E16D6|nr:prepilin-type N-terminal cleavage/methylation domain-containing protein [Paludisphaera rhizosphaerae]